MTRETGGYAFPLIPPCDASGQSAQGYPYPETGMTLRDWFAGQALIGISGQIASLISTEVVSREQMTNGMTATALLAYGLADAMLAERSKP